MTNKDKLLRIADNVHVAEERQMAARAIREEQIYELASLYASNDADTLRAAYAEAVDGGYISRDFALLCREYYRYRKKSRRNESPDARTFLHVYGGDDVSGGGNGIAYVRNNYSDTAYRSLCKGVLATSNIHVQSFTMACEEVYYARAEGCILPIQNTQDGRLSMFEKFTERYGLKITAVTDVTMGDGDSVTRFARLERDIKPDGGKYDYFEVTFPIDADESLSELLSSLNILGAVPENISLRRSAYSDTESVVYLVLDIKDAEIFPLLMYLHYAVPRNNPVGIYRVI